MEINKDDPNEGKKTGIHPALTRAKKPATATCLSRDVKAGGGLDKVYSRTEGRLQVYTRIGYWGKL